MKGYESKSLSRPREGLEVRDASELSMGDLDSGGWIAQSVEHRNSISRVPSSSPCTAVHFSQPVTRGLTDDVCYYSGISFVLFTPQNKI